MNSDHFVQGTCLSMCPLKEIIMREKERLVHVLERCDNCTPVGAGRKYKIKADPKKMVKSFHRSAAGRDLQCPEELRPPYVLKKTVDYLLQIIVNSTDAQWSVVYEFITDRLRSVRQDMVVQQPSFVKCVQILEPIVRFHAFAAYRLCEESIHLFDPKLNISHFNECLIRLLTMYDYEDMDTSSRWEMESLSLLHNIGDSYTLARALSLPYISQITFDMALTISLAWIRNDYFTICRLFVKLPVLHQIVLGLKLPAIRRNALEAMNSAYSSKNLTYPLSNLTWLLLYNNEEEAITECRHYGLKVKEGKVHFLKRTFDCSVKVASMKKIDTIDAVLKGTDVSRMLLESDIESS